MGLSSLKIVDFLILAMVALVTNLQKSSASICSSSPDILTASNGSLKSPNFPSHYPHNTTKVWKIMAPEGHKITLQLHTLNLEPHSAKCKAKCGCDYVKVRNKCSDETPIQTLCGSVNPFIITSAGNELWVEFRSDHSVNNTGFVALYTRASMSCPLPSNNPSKSDYCLQKAGQVECCDRDYVLCRYNKLLANLNGTISTPRYPQEYPPNTIYKWRVTVPQGYVVQINFTQFSTEHCSKCSCDKMSISNGPCEFYEGFYACGRYSSAELPSLGYVSKGRHLFVTFKSNAHLQYAGFSAQYRIALQCTGEKPFSCITNGKPSCCSPANAAVTCSDSRSLQRSHCREGNVCCIDKGIAGCCNYKWYDKQCTDKGSEYRSHCKFGQVCCIVNGTAQCCSQQDAAVQCTDGSPLRSHCPKDKRCCTKNGTATCCELEPVKCTDKFSSQRSQCKPRKVCCVYEGRPGCCDPEDADMKCTDSFAEKRSHCKTGKVCCIVNGAAECCSPQDASIRCIDSGSAQRSHCPVKKRCCTVGTKPMCCSGKNLKSWSLVVTILAVMLMLVQHPNGVTIELN